MGDKDTALMEWFVLREFKDTALMEWFVLREFCGR